MSATTPATDLESHEYECGHCGEGHAPAETVAGAFCSHECHDAHRREKRANVLWRELEQDHRFCATCGRQLKEIERPTDEALRQIEGFHSTTSVVGYQYRTEHARVGEISLDVDDEADRPIVQDAVATGTVCCCGNTSHRHEETTLRERFPFTTAYWLLVASRTLRAEDKHDVRLDRGRLFDAVLERTPIREAIAQAVVLE